MLGLYPEHADKPGLWNGNWNMHWRLCDNRNGRSMLKHTNIILQLHHHMHKVTLINRAILG